MDSTTNHTKSTSSVRKELKMNTINRRKIPRPFNRHSHARKLPILIPLVHLASGLYRSAVFMGNTIPPITTGDEAMEYANLINHHKSPGLFTPIFTIMMVNKTDVQTVQHAYQKGVLILKLIPGGASTNSTEGNNPNDGVSLWDLESYYPVLRACAQMGMVFSGHWELPAEKNGDPIPEIKREKRAIPFLQKLIEAIPELQIIVEHASTAEMIELVKNASANVTATLTPHHALYTYNDVMNGKGEVINPGLFCKPVLKTSRDVLEVRAAMVGGNKKFGFGDDCAWHPADKKTGENPAAGIFSPFSIQIIANLFDQTASLDNLSTFLSTNNLDIYGLEPTDETTTLIREPWTLPTDWNGTPILMGGEQINWQIEGWNWQDYLN